MLLQVCSQIQRGSLPRVLRELRSGSAPTRAGRDLVTNRRDFSANEAGVEVERPLEIDMHEPTGKW